MGFIKTQLKKNKVLLKDNIVLFGALLLANILNYLFRFYVGKSLGPEGFGSFEVLVSLIYIIVIPLMAIQMVISKFVAELKIKEEMGKICYLFSRFSKKIGLVGVIAMFLFLMLSPFLATFLKIGSISPLIILGFSMVFVFLIPVLKGFLQGLQKFKMLGLAFVMESMTKILLGIPLMLLGLGVDGAIGGFALSFFIPSVIVYYFIRKIFKGNKKKFNTSKIYTYSFPVILMLISLTGFYTLDLVLIKSFLNPTNAGYYAALSLFGKIIFFASMSIAMVMFPKVSELYSQNKSSKSLLFKSLLIVLFIGLIASLIYFIIPHHLVGLLFGNDYLIIIPLLGLFGVIMTIYSLVYILSFYNVALHRTDFLYILFFFNLIEMGLITLFHQSLLRVGVSLISVMVLLFLSLVIYTIKNDKIVYNNSGL